MSGGYTVPFPLQDDSYSVYCCVRPCVPVKVVPRPCAHKDSSSINDGLLCSGMEAVKSWALRSDARMCGTKHNGCRMTMTLAHKRCPVTDKKSL